MDSTHAGLEQVKRGLAWWYRRSARQQTESDRAAYEAAEKAARAGQQGLWVEKMSFLEATAYLTIVVQDSLTRTVTGSRATSLVACGKRGAAQVGAVHRVQRHT